MSLGQTINAALSGLRLAQAGIGQVADNIANAETPGFVRKSIRQAAAASATGGGGARLTGIVREIDLFVQRQLRAELSGASYARTVANYYSRIEMIYGQPGALNALDSLYNNFTNSLQALSSSPESIAARSQVLNEASVLSQQLNAMSTDIQKLRAQAEFGITDAVQRVNEILRQIEAISPQIANASEASPELAGLLDTRDALIGELSNLLDIRVMEREDRQVSIMIPSGLVLFDHKASLLSFDGRDGMSALSLWNADSSLRNVGTIRLTSPSGYDVDLIADQSIRSGTIAAFLQMRDQTLVEAQAQLDEIAHAMATALSNRTVAGDAAVNGNQAGFALDLSALQDGNSISLTYTDNLTGTQHRVTIVRVDDVNALPLANSITPDPNDTVIGVSFTNGMGSVAAALNDALGAAGLAFDAQSASTLRVLDDGLANTVNVNGFDATVTTTTFDSGDPALPFFVDGGANLHYTNRITAAGQQKVGFAARIAVNPALKADASRLVHFAAGTQAGDPTRPNYLEEQLAGVNRLFSPSTGIGTQQGPYFGTIGDFIRQTISKQGGAAENSKRLAEGQDIVVNALQQRFAERSGVDIDAEMANLLLLQTAYGANARVLAAVKEMIEVLMRI